ncbi:MAG: CDP-diacylglycerol--serine O-phosphatidyltransferase [Balneolaceae bacterium]
MKYPIQRKYSSFKAKRKNIKSQRPPVNKRIAVPSFFTLMNLLSGFLSIISVAKGDFVLGAQLIVLAGLFDVLDGLMARLANATSDFGIELDSLSDMVSFGVAPGFLIYQFSLHELNMLGVLISALPPLCGAIRLARFNVNARLAPTKDIFIGLPVPAQAIILAAFYLTFRNEVDLFSGFEHGINAVLMPVVITISLLMVSTIPFDKIPRFDRQSLKQEKGKFILFFAYLLLILFFKEHGLMVVITIFILKALITGAIHFFKDDYDPGTEDVFQDYS